MQRLLITAFLTAIPTLFYARLVWSIDRFEKEPVSYLCWAFFWGAVPAAILAVILQWVLGAPVVLILGENTLKGQFIKMALGAPVTEEFLKGLAVAIIYWTRKREFDGWVDGIVYGAMAGFGFAYVENILYLNSTQTWQQWISLFFVRLFVFGGLHGFWTALTGIGFGIARYSHNLFFKVVVIAGGLLLAIFCHFIHNFSLILAEKTSGATLLVALINYGVLTLFMAVLWWVAGVHERKILKIYLADEVPTNLSMETYQNLCKFQRKIPRQKRRALLQVAAELAQKKMQFFKMGQEEGNMEEIAQLRQELKKLQA